MVFARRRSRIQQTIVEIGDASSGFLQFVAMGSRGDQRSKVSTVIATRCSLMRPRTQIRTWSAPRTVRSRSVKPAFNRRRISGHHPANLIHPGELASISSSQVAGRRASAYSGGRDLAAPCRGAARCNCQQHIPAGVAIDGRWRQMPRDAVLRHNDCQPMLFGPASVRVLRDAVVVYLAVDGRP